MNDDIRSALRPALTLTLAFALLLGLAYPLLLTGIGQLIFPFQANGSVIQDQGKAIGSAGVGQAFTSDGYFNTRPSAAGKGYDGLASSGSNLGPTSQALSDRVKGDVERLQGSSPGKSIPADLVTTSASGLDPDISPEAAFFQVERVARVRGIPVATVRTLVEKAVQPPLLGFIGEPRVNVLELNRALDGIAAMPAR